MIHQRTKDLFLTFLRPLFWLNHQRLQRRRRWPQPLCLHVGAGPNYWPGFVNIDMNPRRRLDLWLDVRQGLPFCNNAVEFIYAAEVFEHFYPDELNALLAECFRVLRPGAGLRLVVPDLEAGVAAYRAGQLEWFTEWPRSYQSGGGRLANFLFCDAQHKNTFDFGFAREVLVSHGFFDVQKAAASRTLHFGSLWERLSMSTRENASPRLLYVEALKPEGDGTGE